MTFEQKAHEKLRAAEAAGALRELKLPQGVDFTSNDYLGFAEDPELHQCVLSRLSQIPLGAAGSRLLRGHREFYDAIEQRLAAFVDRDAALLFSSGYQANLALLSSVLDDTSWVFSDEYNHASLIDGMRLASAKKVIIPHSDYAYLETQLKRYQHIPGRKFIVTESVFGMEGTRADLACISELSKRYEAEFIVDEAHAIGVYGSGLATVTPLKKPPLATVYPCGKALGVAGAWIAGSETLKAYLINFARPAIFSTAPFPAMAVAIDESVMFYQAVGAQRATALRQHAVWFRKLLHEQGMGDFVLNETAVSDVPIISILLGSNENTLAVAEKLTLRGWDVRAIRPPTVPEGKARLRITLKWNQLEEIFQRFTEDLKRILLPIPQR